MPDFEFTVQCTDFPEHQSFRVLIPRSPGFITAHMTLIEAGLNRCRQPVEKLGPLVIARCGRHAEAVAVNATNFLNR